MSDPIYIEITVAPTVVFTLGELPGEIDPVFAASPAATITNEDIEGWDAKAEQGEPGVDGREVELQEGDTHLQWRYVGDGEWYDLIAIEDLKGEDGIIGADGREIELAIVSNAIGWRYVDEPENPWTMLVSLSDLKGDQGIQGIQGIDGTNGVDGIDGINGVDGIDGQDGLTTSVNNISHIDGNITLTASDVGAAETGHLHEGTYEPANANIQNHVTASHAPSDAVSLSTVKNDTDIADALDKRHASGSDNQDLSTIEHRIKFLLINQFLNF